MYFLKVADADESQPHSPLMIVEPKGQQKLKLLLVNMTFFIPYSLLSQTQDITPFYIYNENPLVQMQEDTRS